MHNNNIISSLDLIKFKLTNQKYIKQQLINNILIENIDYSLSDDGKYSLSFKSLITLLKNNTNSKEYYNSLITIEFIDTKYQEYIQMYNKCKLHIIDCELNNKEYNFNIICNGNCLLKTIAIIKYNDVNQWAKIKNEISDFLIINREYFKTHLNKSYSLDSWMFCMINSKCTMPDILETYDHTFILILLSHLLERQIKIKLYITSDNIEYKTYGQKCYKEPLNLIQINRHYQLMK